MVILLHKMKMIFVSRVFVSRYVFLSHSCLFIPEHENTVIHTQFAHACTHQLTPKPNKIGIELIYAVLIW
jgi:hypothetical protein